MSKIVQISDEHVKRISDAVLAALDAEKMPWRNPLVNDYLPGNPLHKNQPEQPKDRHHFNGVNLLLIMFHRFALTTQTDSPFFSEEPWNCPYYAQGYQVKRAGGYPRRGARAIPLAIPIFGYRTKELEDGTTVNVQYIRGFTYHTFFNLAETTIEWRKFLPPQPDEPLTTSEEAERLFGALEKMVNGPKVIWGSLSTSGAGVYSPATDTIGMGIKTGYTTSLACAWTLAHEVLHSTGHRHRLSRDTLYSFGSPTAYAKEELIVETGTAILASQLGIKSPEDDANMLAYCQGWATLVRNNPQVIIELITQGSQAASYVLSNRSDTEEE